MNTLNSKFTKFEPYTVSDIFFDVVSALKVIPDVCAGVLCNERRMRPNVYVLPRQTIDLGKRLLMYVVEVLCLSKSLTRCFRGDHYHLRRL